MADRSPRAWFVALFRTVVPIVCLLAGGCTDNPTSSTGGANVAPPLQGICGFSPSQTQASMAVDWVGGSVTVPVTASAGCAWSAESKDEFVTISSGSAGTGDGTVTIAVAANTGGARSATVVIAGVPVTITQQAAPCAFALSGDTHRTFPASGGAGAITLAVTQGAGCAWTVTGLPGFVTVTSSAAGTGAGTVTFTVAANTGAGRSATFTIAAQTVTVNQDGVSPCTFAVSPTTVPVGPAGGSQTVSVTTQPACNWTAASADAFVTVTAGASGSGSGPVTLAVANNTGAARTATVKVAGLSVTVTQDAVAPAPDPPAPTPPAPPPPPPPPPPPTPVPCTFAVSPTAVHAGAASSSQTATVATQPSCGWTAVSNAPFITVTAGASGSSNGTVTFTVAANTGGARSGTLTIAGQAVTVTQDAIVCSFTLSATTVSVGAGGGSVPITVTTQPTCSWTAATNASFITLASGAGGTGNGTATFTVAPNAGGGAARTGTVTVAGQTVTVNQAAVSSCAYEVTGPTEKVPSSGGQVTVTVKTALSCSCTAQSGVPFITVTSGASGAGPGTVTALVAPNTGPARTGALKVAGAEVVVSQAAGTRQPALNGAAAFDPVASRVPTDALTEVSFRVGRRSTRARSLHGVHIDATARLLPPDVPTHGGRANIGVREQSDRARRSHQLNEVVARTDTD